MSTEVDDEVDEDVSVDDVLYDTKRRLLGGRVDPKIRQRIYDRAATVKELEDAHERMTESDRLIRDLQAVLDDLATKKHVREAISKEDQHVSDVTSQLASKIKKLDERIMDMENPPEHIQQRHEMNMKTLRRQAISLVMFMVLFIGYFIVQVAFT